MQVREDFAVIAYDIKPLGVFDLDGTPVQVRERLSGWPNGGLKFWVTDWRVIKDRPWWKFWLPRYGDWHRASDYELRLMRPQP